MREIQELLADIGIFLLSEWDILAFVYHHEPSLTTTNHIARLIGYESTVVEAALERLEREKLIERVGRSQGARLHRMLLSTDTRRQGYLQQLITLSESRSGRLHLAKLLKPACGNRDENNLSLEKRGNWLCLRAI